MPRYTGCTCRDDQLSLVGCCCGAEDLHYYYADKYADWQADADHEQACIEIGRSVGSRFDFSKDLDDSSVF
jgi:hypothetical protein